MTSTPTPRWTPSDFRDRPRDYAPRVAQEMCDQLANGMLLPQVCELSLEYPLPATFLMWVEQNPELAQLYSQAVRLRTDIMLDEAVLASQLPDPTSGSVRSRTLLDHVKLSNPDKYGGGQKARPDDVQRPDYGSEVRRRIESMAKKIRDADKQKAPQRQENG